VSEEEYKIQGGEEVKENGWGEGNAEGRKWRRGGEMEVDGRERR